MKAIKENKEYTVTEENKDFYVRQGFDIVNDDGNIVEHGKGKQIDYSEYQKQEECCRKLFEENRKLCARIAELEVELKNPENSVPKKDARKKDGE